MKRIAKILTITVIVAVIAVGFVGCEPEVKYVDNYYYIGYIYSYEEEVVVEGYKNMDADDFKTALVKLQEVLSHSETLAIDHKRFLLKEIVINAGDAVISVNNERIATIGISYLLDTEVLLIGNDISNAFLAIDL